MEYSGLASLRETIAHRSLSLQARPYDIFRRNLTYFFMYMRGKTVVCVLSGKMKIQVVLIFSTKTAACLENTYRKIKNAEGGIASAWLSTDCSRQPAMHR